MLYAATPVGAAVATRLPRAVSAVLMYSATADLPHPAGPVMTTFFPSSTSDIARRCSSFQTNAPSPPPVPAPVPPLSRAVVAGAAIEVDDAVVDVDAIPRE